MRKMMMAAALALGTASIATPAASQQVTGGLVNVTVGDVILNDILSDNEIDVLRNANVLSGNNVAVPVAVAAAVCNIPVAVLAQQKSRGGGGCTADATNGDTSQLAKLLKRRARQAQ